MDLTKLKELVDEGEVNRRLVLAEKKIRLDLLRGAVASKNLGFRNDAEKDLYFSSVNGWEDRCERRVIGEANCLDYYSDGERFTVYYSRPLSMWLHGEPELCDGVSYCPITGERNGYK